jgi:hypothetical protein
VKDIEIAGFLGLEQFGILVRRSAWDGYPGAADTCHDRREARSSKKRRTIDG